MDVLRVGVVGCGRIAQLAHLPALARLAGVRVVALAEADEARRREAVRQAPQAATFADYRELLAAGVIDAAVVTLPPALHAEAAIAAFDAGQHVYLEKPLATTLADARAVMAAWKRSGKIGMIGFNYRFHPLYRIVKAHLASSRLGELVGVRTVFASTARALPDWKKARQSGGGALMELASHHVDLVHFLFDQPIVEVTTLSRSQHSEADTVSLNLRLADGLLVQSFCSINAVAEDRFEIYGREGKLAVDRYAGTLESGSARHADGRLPRLRCELRRFARGVSTVLRPPGEHSYGVALGAFASAIRDARPVLPGFEQAYQSLAVIDAAERSATSGRVVTMSSDDLRPHH